MLRRRSWWRWLVIPVAVIATWFGWHDWQLARYGATAHQHFVDEFQNGIRGAYSAIEGARRSLTQGKAALAEEQLMDAYYHLGMMRSGATGMSIRLGAEPIPLSVTTRYQQEATMLRGQLLNGSSSQSLSPELENLSHDFTLLLELLGADDQRKWLTHATVDQLTARYQSWWEKARIKAEVR